MNKRTLGVIIVTLLIIFSAGVMMGSMDSPTGKLSFKFFGLKEVELAQPLIIENKEISPFEDSDFELAENFPVMEGLKIGFEGVTFPDMYKQEGKFKARFIVGDDASGGTTLALTDLVQFVNSKFPDATIETQISSEFDQIVREHAIFIGDPCTNELVHKMLGYRNCEDVDFRGYDALVKQKDRHGGEIHYLIIAVEDEQNVGKVVRALKDRVESGKKVACELIHNPEETRGGGDAVCASRGYDTCSDVMFVARARYNEYNLMTSTFGHMECDASLENIVPIMHENLGNTGNYDLVDPDYAVVCCTLID